MSQARPASGGIVVDTTGLRARAARWDAAAAEGRARIAALAAHYAGRQAYRIAPKDTHRYARGWGEAANAIAARAHAAPFAMAPVRPPSEAIREMHERVVRGQLAAVEKQIALVSAWKFSGAHGTAAKRAAARDRALRKLEESRQRAEQVITEFLAASALEIPAVLLPGTKSGPGGKAQILTRSRLATLRLRVYGGVGTVEQRGPVAVATLANREPHARLIEKRSAVARRASAIVRRPGITRIYTDAYLDRVDPAGRRGAR